MTTQLPAALASIKPCPFCDYPKVNEAAVSNTGGYLRYKYCNESKLSTPTPDAQGSVR